MKRKSIRLKVLKRQRKAMIRGVDRNKRILPMIGGAELRASVKNDIVRDSGIVRQYDAEILRLKRKA
ncbi:hypothetical protein FACS1894211_12870 [Clostridia bacterium]|nr:hypothetical protein FACS1894211_12870 [Clostridia bacterium]